MDPLNVFDYELLAKERMDPASWDFYAGGSDDEMTLRANQADFARIRLRPRCWLMFLIVIPAPVCSVCQYRCRCWLLLHPYTVWLILRESAQPLRAQEQLGRS
jgi:hypothetical protein